MEQLVIMLRGMLVCTLAMHAAASSDYGFFKDDFGLHIDFADHGDPEYSCTYRDKSTNKDIIVPINNDLTGELLSGCKVLYCDEEADMVYRNREGCPVGVLCYALGERWTNPCGTYTCVSDRNLVFMATDGCMEDDMCHLEGTKWWTECSERTCEKQADGSFNVVDVSVRQQDEMWSETTTNGCNLLKCSQDGESEKLKIIKTPACMEDDVCHLEGSKWLSECTEKTCEKQEDGSVNVIDVTVRQQDEIWTEKTTNGCNLFECSQDGESAKFKIVKNPGCFFKKDGKCYAVGATKKYVCSTIHCELDSAGDTATFTGLKLECFSLGKCVPLGTKWLYTARCIEQKCGKAVDEYGTELHKVERTKGCYMYDVCRPPGYIIQINPCSDAVCGLKRKSAWSYSRRGCYVEGNCIDHRGTWQNKECDTEKCYVTISKRRGPRVRTRQIAPGCRDANNNCRKKYEKWDEPVMDSLNVTCPGAYKAEVTCSWAGLVVKYVDAC